MEPTLENCILGLLNRLDRERLLIEISQLLESGSWTIPLNILKESKQSVQNLATSAPDLFLYAVAFYYVKFIQSINFINLESEYTLIPEYLKTIKIMKTLCSKINIGDVNFEPFLKSIINSINETFLSYESIEKTFESLNIFKKIEVDFEIPISGQTRWCEYIDLEIQEFVKTEEDLMKSYFVIKTVKEAWNFDLYSSDQSWIAKARRRLREENAVTCDKSLIENILILLYPINDLYPK
ncbi:unnamed protein product [Blepharisma stoltei]|uniref:Uncharacterized protein n=1 Tax=Blepharisma stoltei TaxID=1481888 RepID=A0AAU9JUW6_9CILI|nr:unnamed protein product [Blepharisma stoltei]